MKKLLFMLIALLCSTLTFAQKKVAEYSLDYTSSIGFPSFAIEASEPNNGKFTFYIYGWTLESNHDDVGFYIDSKNLPKFFESLRAVGDKLEEWTKTAKDNNVTDYD